MSQFLQEGGSPTSNQNVPSFYVPKCLGRMGVRREWDNVSYFCFFKASLSKFECLYCGHIPHDLISRFSVCFGYCFSLKLILKPLLALISTLLLLHTVQRIIQLMDMRRINPFLHKTQSKLNPIFVASILKLLILC